MSASPAGPHLSIDLPPLAAAALLDEQAAIPPPPPTPPAHRPRWVILGTLLVAALGLYAVDRAYPYSPAVFSATVPLLWLAAVLAANAGRRSATSGLGCLAALILGLGFVFLGGFSLLAGDGPAAVGGWQVAGASALIVAFTLFSDFCEKPDPPPDYSARIGPWAEVLRALAEDVGPGRRVTGVLDLRGAELPDKMMRTGKAASGADVSIYRDEWLRLRLPLRDGSQLRLVATDRVKLRSEYWKQGARRRKQKPARSERLATLDIQLSVPPGLYRPRAQEPVAGVVGTLAAGAAVADQDRASLTAKLGTEAPAARDVLALVARVFAAFERVA